MKFKVESVTTTNDEGLEKILNDAVPTIEQIGYKIVSIMFIGNKFLYNNAWIFYI